MTAPRECPTVPAMSSISEKAYAQDVANGMSIASEAVRRDTQRRIRLVAEFKGGGR